MKKIEIVWFGWSGTARKMRLPKRNRAKCDDQSQQSNQFLKYKSMKKSAINLLALGMASIGLAQNSHPNFELSKYKSFKEMSINHEYLDEVQNGLTPNQAKYLENLVSYWDVTKSRQFKGRKGDGFDVTFKSGKNYIEASYDANGKIIMVNERFRNFALPLQVSIALAKRYPNWKVVKNKYLVLYTRNNRPNKSFKVQIQKGNQKKWVKIDPSLKMS